MTGSRITVEVTGDPAGLETTVDKSVTYLRKLADEAAASSKKAMAAGKDTTAANRQVAESFAAVARDADAQAKALESAYGRQVRAGETAATAAARVAAAQDAAATATDDASKKSAAAVEAKAARQEQAASVEVAALERVTRAQLEQARVVTASLEEETTALDTQAARYRTSAAVVAESTAKTSAASAAGGAAVARTGKTTTQAILATAAASVYAAAKYQAQTTQYITQAGATAQLSRQLSAGILEMAGAVGQTPDQLAKGMYHVVSALNPLIPAAQRSSAELGILKVAAEGAAVGGANLNDTTYALSSAMNSMAQTTVPQASKTMAELNAIVGAGDMHMQDLEGAMSTGIVPAAQTFGVSLQSVGAALAYMTDTGVPAQQAATRLRMSLSLLGAPSGKAAGLLQTIGESSTEAAARTTAMSKALAAAGLNTTQLSADLRKPDGILVALEDVKRHFESAGVSAHAQGAFISDAFGGGRSGSAIMALFNNLDKLQGKYEQIGRTAGDFGRDYTRTQQTLTFQLHQIEGEVESVGVAFGTKLIPEVEAGINDLKDVAHWLDQNRLAAGALAAVVTTLATVAVGTYLVGKLKAATVLMRGFGEATGLVGRDVSTIAAAKVTGPASAAAATEGEALLGGRGVGIGGVRSGFGLPGSPTDAIVVAVEDPGYAGLGNQGAQLGPEKKAGQTVAADAAAVAPTAERQAATDVGALAPDAVAVGAAAATAKGVMPTLVEGLKTTLGGLARGGMIAGVGVAASQVGGSVIGGKTGHQVSTIGTDAAIGAGLGTLIGPEGTAAGAVIGGLVGAIHTIPGAAKVADDALAELGNQLAPLAPAFHDTETAGTEAFNALKGIIVPVGSDIAHVFDDVAVKSGFMRDFIGNEIHGIEGLAEGLLQNVRGVFEVIDGVLTLNATQTWHGLEDIALSGVHGLEGIVQGAAAPFIAAFEAADKGVQGFAGVIFRDAEKVGAQAISGVEHGLGSIVHDVTSLPGKALSAIGFEGGGLVQIGAPGAKGRDTIPMNVGGVPIIVGPGEQAAVFTHTQQQVANRLLAPVGGLPGLFSSYTTPHYMAGGGFVPAPGTNYSVGQEPIIAADLERLGEALGLHLIGISGYRSPQHSVAVGGFADDPHTRGEASDTPGVEGVPEATLERFGLTRPFPGAAEADHIQLLHGAAAAIPAAAAQAVKLTLPSIPGGPIAAAIGDSVAFLADAAIELLGGRAGATSTGAPSAGGSVGSGGAVTGAGGAWRQIEASIAKQRGWSLADWNQVIQLESGGDPNSRNPSSGAYGLGQFLGSTATEYAKYGALSPDPAKQIVAMGQYIADRYGNPTAALAHEHAYHWYETGGLVPMAAGGDPKAVAATVKAVFPKSKPKVKQATHPKGSTNAKKIQSPVSVGDLTKIPGYAALVAGPLADADAIGDNQSSGLTGALAVLGQLPTSASDGTGPAANAFQLRGDDLTDLGPYLQNLQAMGVPLGQLSAGMSYAQAYGVYKQGLRAMQADLAVNGSTDTNTAWGENLADIQQVLDYVGSDPGHRVLGGQDMAILGTAVLPTVAGTKVTWASLGAPGHPLDLVEAGLDNSLITLYQQMIQKSGGLEQRIHHDIPVFTKRAANVLALEKAELKRFHGLQAQIDAIKVKKAQQALGAAEAAYSTASQKADLHQSVAALGVEIAGERAQPVANKTYLSQLQVQKAAYEKDLAVLGGATSGVPAKQLALTQVLLQQKLRPVQDDLQRLGGSRTTAGQPSSGTSVYGTLQGYLAGLNSGLTGIETNVTGARQGLPARMVDLGLMQSNLGGVFDTTTFNPVGTGLGGSSTDTSVLAGLQAQMNLELAQGNQIDRAVNATIAGIIPLIPAYEHGGPVARTGLALVHQGEYVTPNPRGPYGSGFAQGGPVTHQVTLHVAGDIHGGSGGIAGMVRAEVNGQLQDPANMRIISGAIGSRAVALRGAPGGFRR